MAATDTAIVCTCTNERRRADLSVTKTNTPGVSGEVDQATDAVMAGATSYVVTAGNAGPHAAHGAVVRDLPGANLSGCAATACTASGGAVAFTVRCTVH